MYFYIYVYIYEFRHFFEPDFCLVFIPNPSIFAESALNPHSSPCHQSPRNEMLMGSGSPAARCSVMGNGCEDRHPPTALDQGSIHPCPAALPLTSKKTL